MNSRDLYNKPVRPPRSSKNTKDPGYLMKIVQALSISEDNADRDRQKAILEEEYSYHEKLLWRLVKARSTELTISIQAFSKTSLRFRELSSKCKDIKEKLQRCRTLLNCRREELKTLWLEDVEHKTVLSMLKEIEDVMSVPEKVQSYLKANKYLEATKLLASSILLFEGSLDEIDALKELKAILLSKREELHNALVKELCNILFRSASNNIFRQFKRHGSGRARIRDGSVSDSQKNILHHTHSMQPYSCNDDISRSLKLCESLEVNAANKVSISNLVECVFLLNRVPETIETLKERCEYELLAIVRRTGQHVADTSQTVPCHHHDQVKYLGSEENKEEKFLLYDVMELIFQQFKCIVENHALLLESFDDKRRSKYLREFEFQRSYMADLWSKIQTVLAIFLGEYVDVNNFGSAQAPPPSTFANVPSTLDISSYFHRKRNLKSKNYSLFKFDSSSHAISMKSYLQEQKVALKEKGEMDAFDPDAQVVICTPATKNITIMYKPLSDFIVEIEEDARESSMKSKLSHTQHSECFERNANNTLQVFINRCVKVFFGQLSLEVNHVIEIYSKSLSNFKVISDHDELKKIGVNTLLLHSVVYVNSTVKELSELIYTLPQHVSHTLQIICNMLTNFRDACQNEYNLLIQVNYPEVRIISSSWARDKDINRLLRSLPNWTNLKEKERSDEESPDDIRLRNKKESEILIANLTSDILISHLEILSELNLFRNLALMHESMEWLGEKILMFVDNLLPLSVALNQLYAPVYKIDVSDFLLPKEENSSCISEQMLESLTKLGHDFITIADTCLLLLHLEIRVHCFYYLQPLTAQGIYAARLDNQEPDPEVIKLNNDLSKIDDVLQPLLKPSKIKYIFEGLGELLSTILINSTSKIKRINENGVKKINRNIFALQQNLTSITMLREVALDRACQYFDLLNYSPEEILNLIVENGPQFHELEYSAIFHVLQRIQPGSDSGALENYLERLHQILNEVAVSV